MYAMVWLFGFLLLFPWVQSWPAIIIADLAYSLVSVQAAALRVQDIITRIGETDDIHAAMSLNTYERAELARLIAIRTRLKAAHTRPLSAAELAMAAAQAGEQDFMQFDLEAIR